MFLHSHGEPVGHYWFEASLHDNGSSNLHQNHVLRSPLPECGKSGSRTRKQPYVSWLTRLPGISGDKQPPSERRCLDWFPGAVIWFVLYELPSSSWVINMFPEIYRFWAFGLQSARSKMAPASEHCTCVTFPRSQHQMHQTHPTCEHVCLKFWFLRVRFLSLCVR